MAPRGLNKFLGPPNFTILFLRYMGLFFVKTTFFLACWILRIAFKWNQSVKSLIFSLAPCMYVLFYSKCIVLRFDEKARVDFLPQWNDENCFNKVPGKRLSPRSPCCPCSATSPTARCRFYESPFVPQMKIFILPWFIVKISSEIIKKYFENYEENG
jgi:hypothetical protein